MTASDRGGEPTAGERFAPLYWRVLYACSFCSLTSFPMVLLAFVVGIPWNLLLGVGAAASCALGVRQASQIALIVHDQGVTVKNFVRTYQIAWPEIAAVEVQEVIALGGARKNCVTFVRRRPRGSVDAYATLSSKTRAQALRALESLAKDWGVSFDVPAEAFA
jgi:hypothetical protein